MKVAVEPSSKTFGRTVLAARPQPSTASDAPVYTARRGSRRTSSGHRASTATAGNR
jgi:hypothetical protein